MDHPNHRDLHVGTQVRARRKVLGISDEKLADSLGVSLAQMLAWELGVTRIEASWLSEIAKALERFSIRLVRIRRPRNSWRIRAA
jgi:transcriptional regulator with XRE-family HTH domain